MNTVNWTNSKGGGQYSVCAATPLEVGEIVKVRGMNGIGKKLAPDAYQVCRVDEIQPRHEAAGKYYGTVKYAGFRA